MGEYIKHPALKEEVKIGVYRGRDQIEAFYPKWVLEKFLSSGYEPKETIQSFLDDAEKVQWCDYKQFSTSPLLQVVFYDADGEKKQELIEDLVAEGYVILVQAHLDDPGTIMLFTTEYGKPFVEEAATSFGFTPTFYQRDRSMPDVDVDFQDESREEALNYVRQKYGKEAYPRNGELDVFISDETQSEERPGYDVDVYDTFDEDGGKGDRREDLTKTGFPTIEDAEAYIKELEKTYKVNRLN